MDYGKAFSIIRRSAPNMSLDHAFELVDYISSLVYFDASRKYGREAEEGISLVAEATLWGYRNLSESDLRVRKAFCIKRLREEFPKLSLKQGKAIAEFLKADDGFS